MSRVFSALRPQRNDQIHTAPHIPGEGGKSGVVSFVKVYNSSLCQPREMLVDILQEYPEEIEYIFIPSCVVLMRCGGCCNDDMYECVPTETYNITMEVMRFRPKVQRSIFQLSFIEHRRCDCRPKKEVVEKKENHCAPCAKRRKQDPLTCQCTCKNTELDCKSRQLELNERTCRCDKPRR
ncbi:vascular endothelial growth factor Ab isoform X2 [Scleropages formosus]|uniref:Vascular endothelial growth factor Ab n=1 Tax=Scleropages formosus TaxID=113540 RepID=A0A8C9W7B9_SCLFO|nr:vascular endothelial growth factor A isoform X2 [Scleropages formosus]